ncbi:MAG: hypothetical protein PHS62_02685 [Patescibacteria group bacterium]|nr:hypothetical protein [Patescibacteria group bacterium]
MKKTLFYCLLAVFAFSLATNVWASDQTTKKSQTEVLAIFKTAMADRFANLNYNKKTGATGVYNYIITHSHITMTTYEAAVVNAMDTPAKLDWFKARLLLNTDGALSQTNKDGIRQAMNARYSDLCIAPWNATIKTLTATYKKALVDAEKARKGVRAKAATATTAAVVATGEELCKADYSQSVKALANSTAYDKAAVKYIALERLKNVKDQCVNATYTAFYTARVAALANLETGKTAANTTYTACVGDRLTSWNWGAQVAR